MKNQGTLSTVRNALRILNSYTLNEPEKKITEIAASLNMTTSTVSRLMGTLASEGFVIKDPLTQKYRLGLSILNLSGIITSTMDIYKIAHPLLENLAKATDETCHLAMLEGTEVIYFLKFESSHPIQVQSHVGKKNPAYCVSSGKVLLAYQNPEIAEGVIRKGLRKLASNTITDPEKFREELKKVRSNGYAISIHELAEDVASVGAPVRDYLGNVIAAITIVGPVQRMHSGNIHRFVKKAMEVADEISAQMGYRKNAKTPL